MNTACPESGRKELTAVLQNIPEATWILIGLSDYMKHLTVFTLAVITALIICSCAQKAPSKQYDSIFDAVRAGDINATDAFLQKDPALIKSVDTQSQYGGPPLYTAAVTSYTGDERTCRDMAAFLIKKGADVNYKDKNGETPLHLVAAYGKVMMAELFIEKGANVNAACTAGWTPLHQASMKGKKEIAALLIKKGALINAEDSSGNTPLHCASGWGRKDVVEVLVADRAEVNARDRTNHTPLDYALKNKHDDVAQFLKAHGGKTGGK